MMVAPAGRAEIHPAVLLRGANVAYMSSWGIGPARAASRATCAGSADGVLVGAVHGRPSRGFTERPPRRQGRHLGQVSHALVVVGGVRRGSRDTLPGTGRRDVFTEAPCKSVMAAARVNTLVQVAHTQRRREPPLERSCAVLAPTKLVADADRRPSHAPPAAGILIVIMHHEMCVYRSVENFQHASKNGILEGLCRISRKMLNELIL